MNNQIFTNPFRKFNWKFASLPFLYTLMLAVVASCCSVSNAQDPKSDQSATQTDNKNSVIVMGMIHRKHRDPGPYDLDHLKDLIRKIKPDYVLTEIPPDRLEEATKQFEATGKITESRVRVFPEYTDALFPLTKEMKFEIVPCAAWNKAMNDSRRATLAKAQQTHAKQHAEMNQGQQMAAKNIAGLGNPNDPVVIHTQQYDDFVKIGMEPYDRHFNEMIGEGGWTNINAGHYSLIAKALDERTGQGKKFLITFGSWHKYYIKEQLRKRSDIKLVSMSKYLNDQDSTPANWPRFRLNSSGNNALGVTEIQSPEVAWKYPTGDVIESSPVVIGNSVFVGGHAKNLHSIDRKTGKLNWKFETEGWIRATPSVVDGTVYVGSDDNKFYAVDAKTGEKKWEFKLGEGGEQSSPTILDGVVYFGAFDHFVYALKADSGELVWKFDVGSSILSSPTVTDDALYIGTYTGSFFRLNRQTGKKDWEFKENDKAIYSSPVANQEIVTFTSYDRHVYGVNVKDGSVKWKRKTDGDIFSSPTMIGDRVYVGSNDSQLYALNSNDGEVVWKTDLGGAVFSSPAVTDASIYVGSSDGHLYAVNRNDGSVRWKHLFGKGIRVWSSPTAIEGTIFVGSHAGEVIALREKMEEKK